MPAKKPGGKAAEETDVLFLLDHLGYGVKCGEVATVPAEFAETLKNQGIVDDNPEALENRPRAVQEATDDNPEPSTDD